MKTRRQTWGLWVGVMLWAWGVAHAAWASGLAAPQFVGVWDVDGDRDKVEGVTADYQQQAAALFKPTIRTIITISETAGGGYQIVGDLGNGSDTPSPIVIDKVEDNTTYGHSVRQYKVHNVVIKESLVMSATPVLPNRIEMLRQIEVWKPSEAQRRCLVRYQMVGRRRLR